MTTTRFLRLPAVIEMTGLGRDSIYRLGQTGEFPRPKKISARASAWDSRQVQAWMDSRPVSDRRSPNAAAP